MPADYGVYVAELDDGSLYVGSTAHPFEHRLRQHQERGDLAAQVGGRAFVKLRPDLFEQLGRFAERHQAERAERQLANALRHRFRRQGIMVRGGGTERRVTRREPPKPAGE